MADQWLGLVDPETGELISVGTDAMLGPETPPHLDIIEFAEKPDFSKDIWNQETRAFDPRPAPVLRDRLDDIEGWLLADPDFIQVWNTMTTTQRSTMRAGLRRVLARVAGARRMRQIDEPAELD